MLYASSYLHTLSPKRMIFANNGAYVDRNLAPIKPRASHICISCVGYDALRLASVPSSAVQEISPSDLSELASYQNSLQNDELLQYNMTLDSLCEYGVKNGILVAYKIYTATFVPYITQLPGAISGDKSAPSASLKTYRLFALDVSNVDSGAKKRASTSHNSHSNAHRSSNAREQTRTAKLYENLSAQILVPLVFLPLALDECPSGIYALDDWICVYQEGRLVYDCLCKDFGALSDCLAFVESFCGVKCGSIAYVGGFLEAYFGAQNAKSCSAESASKLNALDSATLESIPESTETTLKSTESALDSTTKSTPNSALDSSPAKIPQGLAHIRFSPIAKSLAELLIGYMDRLQDPARAAGTPLPLYNERAKSIIQTKSFWYGIKIAACCVGIIALPFTKLAYASYAQTQAQILERANAKATQALNEQKTASALLPQQIASAQDTIHTLSTIHARYLPRLKLIALISQIASKNTAWITDLKLQSHLEKGEVTLDLHITSARMDNITQLLYALKNEPSLQIIDENIESSAQILDKDMLDKSAQRTLESSAPSQNTLNQNALDKDDLPSAKITLKMLYA